MLSYIRSLLGISEVNPSASTDSDAVRAIVNSLESMEPEKARYLAAFAYLLSRVAYADLEISHEETEAMERIVIETGQLSQEQAILVVQIAKSETRLVGGTENFLVARQFKEISTKEQKLALLHCLFAIAAADEHVSTVEDNEIAKIAYQLSISNQELANARSGQKKYLGSLNPDKEKS